MAEPIMKMEEYDLSQPLLVAIEHDETSVRWTITVKGASGRSYPEFARRDERGTYDLRGDAKLLAGGLADRLRKQGRTVIYDA